MNRNFLQIISQLFGYLLFGIALWFIYVQLRQYHLSDVIDELKTLPVWQVLLSIAFMVADYFTLTFYDVLAFEYIGKKLPYKKIAVASFIGHAFSINMNVLTGSSMRYRLYSKFGVTLKDVTHIVAFCYISFLLGFLTLAGVLFQFVPLVVPPSLKFRFLSLESIGVLFLIAVVLYVSINRHRKNPLNIWKWEIPVIPFDLSVEQIFVATIDWVSAGTALFFLLPPSAQLSYPLLLAIFLVAQVAGQVSQAPAGLGVFEASALLMLSPFAQSDAIIGALLLYRAFYYFIPLLLATLLLGKQELGQRPPKNSTRIRMS